ncbi:MAG: hypothetical protein JSW33_00895 [bacterium]|nr:MAG: hypothetical protein JSW33_00895 [bacterium]
MKNVNSLPDHKAIQVNPVEIVAAFTVIYLVWGSTYLAICLAIKTRPPFLVAIFLGWVWMGEPVTKHSIIGSGCILMSILLVNKPKLAMKALKDPDNIKNKNL